MMRPMTAEAEEAAIRAYLANCQSGDKADELMEEIMADPAAMGKARTSAKTGLRLCGKSGLPGVDRDGVQVDLILRQRGKIVMVKGGQEYQVASPWWVEVFNKLWVLAGK